MNFPQAIQKAKETLKNTGYKIESRRWQGQDKPMIMWEALNVTVKSFMPESALIAQAQLEPNLPWADLHFEERIGGVPVNPPDSHKHWPFARIGNAEFLKREKFSHTYPERIWPKLAADAPERNSKNIEIPLRGIRFDYGDLNDLINLLIKDPQTRQAYLPIWFPEDTGAVLNQRVPCTLGYHFIIRHDYIHVVYYIRSCDYFRHFRDDIYLAWKLCQYIRNETWPAVKMGTFTMHITSLHCFYAEIKKL